MLVLKEPRLQVGRQRGTRAALNRLGAAGRHLIRILWVALHRGNGWGLRGKGSGYGAPERVAQWP
jgi:hypothetical protein